MTTLHAVPPVPAEPSTTTPTADLFRRHRLDLVAVEEGKWVDVRGDLWLVARLGCKAIGRERADALAELGLPANSDTLPHQTEAVQARIFARAIVRGMRLRESPSVTYTPEHGLRIYHDPELRELRDALMIACQGDYTQEATAKAAILGNF